ncbi:hypothetical protein RRSWK_06154 [Rhodopirellula sp. SWK7]|nr:hypothetical protein RRSWK_06154 [Rhodopirellula sp. SWK7]
MFASRLGISPPKRKCIVNSGEEVELFWVSTLPRPAAQRPI